MMLNFGPHSMQTTEECMNGERKAKRQNRLNTSKTSILNREKSDKFE